MLKNVLTTAQFWNNENYPTNTLRGRTERGD